jgi:hypothetical protein
MLTRRSIVVAIWLWAGCSLAAADPYVKITQPRGEDGSGTSCSSGTLIGWTTDLRRGIFLSCGHGYDRKRKVIGRVTNAKDAGLIVPAETVRLFVRRNIALFYTRRAS